MSEAAARAVLAFNPDRDSWRYIVDHPGEFMWSDNAETLYDFNAVAAQSANLVEVSWVPGESTDLSFRDRQKTVTLAGSREDCYIILHALAALVRDEMEIRFCIDSAHSSDTAFLPLPPTVWRSLEQEFGEPAVAYRFLAIAEDYDQFMEDAFGGELRTYAGEPREEESEESRALRSVCEQILQALQTDYPELYAHARHLGIMGEWDLFLGFETDAEMARLRQDAGNLGTLKPVIEDGSRQLGLRFRGVRLGSAEGYQRSGMEHPLMYQLGLPLEFPEIWRDAAPKASGVAPAAGPAVIPAGSVPVRCIPCRLVFHAVPTKSQYGFLVSHCPKCGRTINLGLTPGGRLFFWLGLLGSLGLTGVLIQESRFNPDLLVALACWAGFLLFDHVMRKRQR